MKNHVERFVKDESGATAIEYGLIAALFEAAWSARSGGFNFFRLPNICWAGSSSLA